MNRARARDDRGASLILVMGLLIFIGFVSAATLSYAGASITATSVADSRVASDFAVDGALQAGVNQLRNSTFVDSGAGSSPDPCPTVKVPGTGGADSVTVTCEPDPGSGANSAAITAAPSRAVLATATGAKSGEVGIIHRGTSTLAVAGGLSSNSTISASPGAVVVNGAVAAVAGCTGSITGTSKDCSAQPVSSPIVTQPTSGMTRRTVPTCPGNGSTITFKAGFYDDAAALNSLMSSCTDSTFWFPGDTGGAAYYFDFHNGEPGHPKGSHVWRINSPGVRIVGGGTTKPGRPSTVAIPGSCTSPLVAAANNGVQFVFGGDSRLSVSAGQVELCGPGDAAGGAPPVAIMGGDKDVESASSSGAGTAGPANAPSKSKENPAGVLKMESGTASLSSDPKVVGFGNNASQRNRVVEWDNKPATASLDGTNQPTDKGERGYLKFTGYLPSEASPASTIPAGAVLTYANVYVRHREPRKSNSSPKDPVAFIQVRVTPLRAGAPPVGPPAAPDGFTPGLGTNPDKQRKKYRIDTIDLLATSALQDEVTAYGFDGASIEYTVETTDRGELTASLDTVQIAMGWGLPEGFRKQTTLIDGANCVAVPTTAYPGAGACPLVQVTPTDGLARFHIQGTVLAPRAAIDLGQDRVSAPVISSGLVARQLTNSVGTVASFTGPVINLPRPLTVLLRAYTCPQGTCTGTGPVRAAPWKLAGTALVEVSDPRSNVVAGARAVNVRSWSIER